MLKRIARLLRGSRPTLLDTDKANELIDAINALQNITIMEGEETKVSVSPTGINFTIRKEKPVELPNINIEAEPPLMIKKLDKYNYKIWIEGYTRKIKYCGGDGHLLHLGERYNSTEIEEEDFANSTINSSASVAGTPQNP